MGIRSFGISRMRRYKIPMSATARSRILANLGLDGMVAALAVPAALWLALPGVAPPAGWWTLALPAGAACLLLR